MKRKKIHLKLDAFFSGVNTELHESVLKPTTAKLSHNFCFRSGALTSGIGMRRLTAPNGHFNPNFDLSQPFDHTAYRNVTVSIPQDFYPNNFPAKVFHYKQFDATDNFKRKHSLVFFTRNGLYFHLPIPCFNLGQVLGLDLETQLDECPKDAVNFRIGNEDVLLLFFENMPMHVYNLHEPAPRRVTVASQTPRMTSVAVFMNRLFAIVSGQPNKVYYSALRNPLQWNNSFLNAGDMDLTSEHGQVKKLITLGDFVYVFREYGISRIGTLGQNTDIFRADHVVTHGSRIYEDTVAVCGDRIVFYSPEGFFSFDGRRLSKIKTNIENKFCIWSMHTSKAAYINGKYYLAARLEFDEPPENLPQSHINNSIIEIDVLEGISTIHKGFDVEDFSVINEEFFARLSIITPTNVGVHTYEAQIGLGQEEGRGQYLGTHLKKRWLSPRFDLNLKGETKTLKRISLRTKFPLDVVLRSDEGTRVCVFEGKEQVQSRRLSLKGSWFEVEFMSDTSSEISEPELVFETREV
ncbi:MAG: hypothetical protein FWD89_02155 [Firmicutes bacterium]|nr:hypothetical protein [Bacillota bacterium]